MEQHQQQQELGSPSPTPTKQHQHQHQHQMNKPRLEIPDPTKLAGSSSSPRSMHGFPESPQSPDNASASPQTRSEAKSFEEDWSSSAPLLNSSSGTTPLEGKKINLNFVAGEFVLVRCNTSKWLLGQVRRSSKCGFIVWVGAAHTLVNVPFELLASHLVKLESPCCSQPSPYASSGSSSIEAIELTSSGELRAPFRCVRPAHLSHRKLYQPLLAGRKAGLMRERSSSASLPEELSMMRASEQEVFIPAVDRERVSYSVCMFRFPEDDGSLLRKLERSSSEGAAAAAAARDWITVIENGLDIRNKKPPARGSS